MTLRSAFARTLTTASIATLASSCVEAGDELPEELDERDIQLDVSVEPRALMLHNKGYVNTTVAFSEFFNGPFTLSAWVMPQFTYSYLGPIIAENGTGTFIVGQGDYRSGNGGNGIAGEPVLYVQIGNKIARYLAPGYGRKTWNHIALVRTPQSGSVPYALPRYSFKLYVDGVELTPFVKNANGSISSGNNISFTVAEASPFPVGTVRFGRRTSGLNEVWSKVGQFYGLVDDVAIFDDALTPAEIVSVADDGFEDHDDLIAGWTFDQYGLGSQFALPPEMKRGYTLQLPAYRVPDDTNNDALQLDSPFFVAPTQALYRPPFAIDDIWYVVQAPDTRNGSHNGSAAFCWDLVKDGGSAGELVKAAADGELASINEHIGDPVPREPYYAWIRTGDREFLTYLHLQQCWFSELIYDSGDCPAWTFPPQTGEDFWIPLAQGDTFARVGPNANHLHICLSEGEPIANAKVATMPMAFTDYERSTDKLSWTHVLRGMPQAGEYIRRLD